MPIHRPLLILTAALALGAAGCGGDDNGSSSSSGGGYGSSAAPAKKKPATAVGAIAIKGFAFAPADATVKVGQKITWTNDDAVSHNVVAKSGETFESKTLAKGDTFAYTPTKAGTISYVCTFHPQMKATLTVTG
jgi:plastocyanin